MEALIWAGVMSWMIPPVVESADGQERAEAADGSISDVWRIEYLCMGESEARELLGVRSHIPAAHIRPCTPLSSAERAEWAALARRIQ